MSALQRAYCILHISTHSTSKSRTFALAGPFLIEKCAYKSWIVKLPTWNTIYGLLIEYIAIFLATFLCINTAASRCKINEHHIYSVGTRSCCYYHYTSWHLKSCEFVTCIKRTGKKERKFRKMPIRLIRFDFRCAHIQPFNSPMTMESCTKQRFIVMKMHNEKIEMSVYRAKYVCSILKAFVEILLQIMFFCCGNIRNSRNALSECTIVRVY